MLKDAIEKNRKRQQEKQDAFEASKKEYIDSAKNKWAEEDSKLIQKLESMLNEQQAFLNEIEDPKRRLARIPLEHFAKEFPLESREQVKTSLKRILSESKSYSLFRGMRGGIGRALTEKQLQEHATSPCWVDSCQLTP